MKSDVSQLHLNELTKAFLANGQVQKSALRSFYARFEPPLTEQTFRRILYALEKRQALTPIASGIYAINENAAPRMISSSLTATSPTKTLRRYF